LTGEGYVMTDEF